MNDVSPELKNFLNFVGKGQIAEEDIFVKILDEKIKQAKHNTVWRDEYMFLITREDEKFAEGREEGIYEDKQRVATDMLKESYPIKAIAKISKLSEDVIRGIAINLGVSVVS